jgi:tetratricopeptide (TPR) repeat protein
MRANKWALLAGLLLCQGCTAGWLPIGDVQSRVERREVKRQLRLLASEDKDIWPAAYWNLVDRGIGISSHLIHSLDARNPLAERAMLVLGELADPSTIAHLKMLQEDVRLGASATRALQISEEALWRRVREEQDRASCEAYLTWFPGGQHRWAVQRRLHDLDAQEAHAALGEEPSENAIAAFLQNFGDTDLGAKLRVGLAEQRVAHAAMALEQGRVREALQALEQARNWNPKLEFRGLEGKVRGRLGRILAAEGDLHGAIVEFAKARSMGETVEMELGRLLVERSQRRQVARDFQGALEDLDVALSVYKKLVGVIKRRRRDIEKQLLREIKEGVLDGDSVASALLRAGSLGRKELARRLEGGKNLGLVERLVADAAKGTDTLEMRAFRRKAVGDLLSRSEARAQAFFATPGRLARLLDGERLWDPSQGPSRDEARSLVRDHTRALRWEAALAERSPGAEGQPSDPLQLQAVVDAHLLAAQGPDEKGLGLTMRVQLLDRLLRLHSDLQARVRQQPLLFAAGLVGLEEIPSSLTAWGGFMLRSPDPENLRFRNGLSARMEAARTEGKLRIRLVLEADLSTELAVAEALTVLFGAARSLVHHHGDLEGVTVEVGRGTPFELKVRVALSRESIRRFNWALIQDEAPFGLDHLAFVFDQEIH